MLGWIDANSAIGNDVLVTVADRGIGIDPSEHERIFDPFYRAAAVVEAQIQGAGLGLSLQLNALHAYCGRPRRMAQAEDRANPRHPQFILTVHGMGYKFAGRDSGAASAPSWHREARISDSDPGSLIPDP